MLGKAFDFLYWWNVEPRDDWPHLLFDLATISAIIVLAMIPLFIEAVFDTYGAYSQWKSPARPFARLAVSVAIGAAIGTVSALCLARPAIGSPGLRHASLAFGPILVGMTAACVTHLRGPRRSPVGPRFSFASGFLLAAAIVVARVLVR